MKKKCMFILFLFLIFSLSACTMTQKQYARDTAITLAQVSMLKGRFAYIEDMVEKQSKSFPVNEQEKLQSIKIDLDLIVNKLDNLFAQNPPTITLSETSYLYEVSKAAYEQAYDIIESEWVSFNPRQQAQLKAFDMQARQTAAKIEELLNNPDNDNINSVVMGVATLGEIIIKVLPLVI